MVIASPFRIWNSSVSIQSLPRALFVVMFHKAHLTSHSKMSGSRWVITPSCLSGLLRPFLNSSSVYSWHLFLISSLSVRNRAECVFSVWGLLPQPINANWLSVGGVRFWIGVYPPLVLPCSLTTSFPPHLFNGFWAKTPLFVTFSLFSK